MFCWQAFGVLREAGSLGARLLVAVLMLLLAGCKQSTTSKETPNEGSGPDRSAPLSVGLLPDQTRAHLIDRTEPVRLALSKKLGRAVEIVVPETYSDLVQQLVDGRVQVALFGGLTYLRAAKRAPIIPLAMRKKDTRFRSYIIANKGKGIESVEDLKGKTFAFGSEASTSGHLMPRYFLKRKGIDPDTDFDGPPSFSGDHEATLQWVLSGRAAAGALNTDIFDEAVASGEANLDEVSVIGVTPRYVDYIWAARSDVPAGTRDQIAEFFVELTPGDPADAPVLQALSADYYVAPQLGGYVSLKRIANELNLLK